jgi:hypothetical protein
MNNTYQKMQLVCCSFTVALLERVNGKTQQQYCGPTQPPHQPWTLVNYHMDSLIWLALVVIFLIIARICVTIITPNGVPRRRGFTETCHLAVFLGSGKLDMICIIHRPHAQIALLSRWSQQRGPVIGICTRFLTLYPEDVPGKRGGHTQRTKGRHIGAAQNCLGSISRKCYLLPPRGIPTDRDPAV